MDEDRRYELDLAPRKVRFILKVYYKEGDKSYDRKCDELKGELKDVLGEDAKIDSFVYMTSSMIFHIMVLSEKEEETWDIIRRIVENYFPS